MTTLAHTAFDGYGHLWSTAFILQFGGCNSDAANGREMQINGQEQGQSPKERPTDQIQTEKKLPAGQESACSVSPK
ncbi:MAG: hypothetical protein WAK21_12835, partial [Candidatus Sulfotelmatobacter sp.]